MPDKGTPPPVKPLAYVITFKPPHGPEETFWIDAKTRTSAIRLAMTLTGYSLAFLVSAERFRAQPK